jgi:hypothetical protein
MAFPEGLVAREVVVCVVERVRVELVVVAAVRDRTRVLLMGVEGREVARDESWKRRPVADLEDL